MDASFINVITVLAASGLGLSAGALLAEGAVLVPFWRSLESEQFLRWYQQHASLLLRFFGPLEIVPALLVVLATAISLFDGRPGSALLALSSLLAIAVLLTFPLYFRSANTSFAAGTLAAEKVGAELRRWSSWHWARTFVAIAAFVAALLALGSHPYSSAA
jgi:hypothetical protein